MDYTVLELGELAGVPAVGGTYEVAGDALEGVDVLAVAVRALMEIVVGVLEAAVEAAVAVVVDAAVADVVLVHQVDDLHNGLRVVGGVAVDLYIEDVTGVLVLVVRALDLGLMLRGAMIVHRDVAGVGIVVLVGDTGKHSEDFLVSLGELACEALGGSRKEGEVVLEGLGEAVDLFSHVGDDAKSEFLGFLAFAVMLADEGDKAFSQAYEADGKGTLVHYRLDGILAFELLTAEPQAVHKERELLLEGGLLEVEALVKLLGGDFESPVEFLEEALDAGVFVGLLVHCLDGELYDIDGREAEVAAADGCLRPEAVAVNAGAAAHGGDFVLVALGIVGLPGVVLVEGGVEVEDVREEAACAHLAGEFIKVIVGILGQIADPAFFLPYLDREDGC